MSGASLAKMPACNEGDRDIDREVDRDHSPHCDLPRAPLHNKLIPSILFFFFLPMVNRSGNPKYATKKRPPPKTSRREMSLAEKGMIIAFFYCLRNIALVAKIIGRPWTTVKSFLVRACERQSLENLPRPGRTPILSAHQRRTIIRAAKSNRKMTRSTFRDKYAPGVSLDTGKSLCYSE